ncbi:MAG: 50S ribosome-binding GTPase [Bacteriovorax sp.]|nr:50S ribosome-binding GTPase [Bacteriovorax sp.]
MNFYTDDHPIIACSTGSQANTAIAVIRLSGFKSLLSLQPYFSFSLTKTKPRFSHLTNIIFEKQIFDNSLMVFFPEGGSYTGENVLELSVHGNLLNIQKILDLFITKADFRSAHPGEFTYRALKNKKLSLSQVEGLDMLLNANSSLMLSQGLDILQGELHAQYMHLYDSFLKLKAAIEISIDFSEDIGEKESKILFNNSFNSFLKILESLHARTQGNISSLLSPEMVLVGQTNAGKSSLFNLLVKHNRSIVSSIAGTTRDYISEVIHIDGTNYNLVDTAGIRESNDVIENIGIDRAFEILKRAFFKILIVNPFETNSAYLEKLADIEFDFLIFSHSDKPNFLSKVSDLNLSKIKVSKVAVASFATGSIGPIDLNMLKSGPIGPTYKTSSCGSIGPEKAKTGSKTGSIGPEIYTGPIEPVEPRSINTSGSIGPLVKNLLADKFRIETSNSPILLERHRACINILYLKAIDLSYKIKGIDDAAILSSEVNIFANYLNELIGIVSPDDVLNSIFANFCIGK